MVPISTTPIIEEWVFDLAQSRFEENKVRVRRQPKRFYLLGGLIMCSDCGRPYVSQTYPAGKQRRVNDSQIYRHRMTSGHCTNRSILAKIIEHMIWDEVVQLLKDPQSIRQGYQEALDQQNSLLSRNQTHLNLLSNRLEKLDLRRKNLNSAYIDPDILMPKVEYLEQIEK